MDIARTRLIAAVLVFLTGFGLTCFFTGRNLFPSNPVQYQTARMCRNPGEVLPFPDPTFVLPDDRPIFRNSTSDLSNHTASTTMDPPNPHNICSLEGQEFSEASQTCVSKVGGACVSNYGCVPHSECDAEPMGWKEMGTCNCKGGFVVNLNRTCDVEFGHPCNNNATSGEDIPCDTVAGLSCLNQECSCGQGRKYEAEFRKCLGLVGTACEEPEDCIEGTSCRLKANSSSGFCAPTPIGSIGKNSYSL